MVSKKPKNKKSGVRVRMPQPKPKASIRGGLDKHAMDYARLLADPCNADLVMPVSNVTGTGNIIRTRVFINPGTSAVDSIIELAPMRFAGNGDPGPNPIRAPIVWGSSNTTGVAPANLYNGGLSGAISSAAAARAIAACIKVHYTGSELNRQGLVATNLTNQYALTAIGPTSGDLAPVGDFIYSFPSIHRVGEVKHEVRWVPTQVNDLDFVPNTATMVSGSPEFEINGGAIQVGVTGAYPGTITYEVIIVWEVQYGNDDGPSGLVSSVRVDRSRNTMKDVLQALGDLTKWATDPDTASRFKRIGGMAFGAIRTGLSIASAF